MDSAEPTAVPPILDPAADRLAVTRHRAQNVGPAFAGDRPWLVTLTASTAVEFGWWLFCRAQGIAPLPLLGTYLGLAAAAFAGAWLLRGTIGRRRPGSAWLPAALALALLATGASLFLPLKYSIPGLIPFWLDVPLATAERAMFGLDPWQRLDQLLGWAAVPIDRIYAFWLPVQTVVLFLVVLEAPSPAKSRALMAHSLAWLILGVGAALLFSSAGPIFYDRLFAGSAFAGLAPTLERRGAWAAITESNQMWAAYAGERPGLVAGISAMPSIHVAVSVWIYLAARSLLPRAGPLALGYAFFIWIASVQLGWHYIADGLFGGLGMIAIWAAAGAMEKRMRRHRPDVPAE